MYITRIFIKNFKSIKEIDIYPNKWLNVFIWENSVGKSNIFKALDWILWKAYPTFNQISREDHFMWDYENKIQIIIEFDDRMTFWLNENEERYKFKMTQWNNSFFNDETRKKYCCAYLDTKREITDYMPSNRWSLLGRILQEINTKFLEESVIVEWERKLKKEVLKDWLWRVKNKLLFTVEDNNGENIMDSLLKIIQSETSEQLNRNWDEFNIDFNLYDPWNFYRTLQITVKEDNWLEFQAWSLWMWVQASISMAILKAYAELNLNNNAPIILDEPELYLHPQAQRNFYNILKEVSLGKQNIKWTQIFYTTHSPSFLNLWNFNEIFIVRKSKENWTYIKSWDINNFIIDLKNRTWIDSTYDDFLIHTKNAYEETGDSQKSNEAFFAKKIILVEWQSESLILPYLFEKSWFNYIKEWITIVRCWSKNELDRFYRVYTEFWIPCYVIFDGDRQHVWTSDETSTINKNKKLFELLDNEYLDNFPDNQAKDKYFWFEETLEKNLWFNTTKKWLWLYREVRAKINDTNIPKWFFSVIEKIKNLNTDNVQSVLILDNESEEIEDIPF